jgi:hypothetical protein
MACLEDIKSGVSVRGIAPEGLAKIVRVECYGDRAIEDLYDNDLGVVRDKGPYRDEGSPLEICDCRPAASGSAESRKARS